jgi:hypothetical protein
VAEHRRQHLAALIGQSLAHRSSIALDQARHHHLLRRGVRDAGRLPVGAGGQAEKQEAFGR